MSSSVSMLKLSLTAGGLAFLAYCVYFDRKRRSDPDFKKKLREKRLKARKSKENKNEEIPIFKNADEMQNYFLNQVQLGDAALSSGNMNDAIIHFANAAVVCTQKSYFLDAMQKSLPAPLFQLLYQQYRITNERYFKRLLEMQGMAAAGKMDGSAAAAMMEEPDIE